jgi:hypothetical protein
MDTQDKPRFWDMNDVQDANDRHGHYFFEPAAMRFFHSRIGHDLHGGRYFVTSECREPGETPRLYTVREAMPDGSINSVGDFQAFSTSAQAKARIRALLASDCTHAVNSDCPHYS